MYTQAMNETGFEYSCLADLAWVARQFPLFTRSEKLPFSYHQLVASKEFSDDDRQKLLNMAVPDNREAFRALVKEYRKQLANHGSTAAVRVLRGTRSAAFAGSMLAVCRPGRFGTRRVKQRPDHVGRGVERAARPIDAICAPDGAKR